MYKRYTHLLTLFLGLFLTIFCAAYAAAPIAVLKSAKNAETYQSQNIGTFDEDWQAFKRTLESANLRYDVIPDADLNAAKLSQYKVLILPLLVDLPEAALAGINQFVSSGGKILVTDGGGSPSKSATSIDALAGAGITNHNATQDPQQLVWPRSGQNYQQDFAVGTLIAEVQSTAGSTQVAKWVDANGKETGTAISKSNGNIFL
ncbi:MAG: beta-galactosidase trimerization domain-containing protein, partial [Candidatus Obscuribacterales bacterium]|nr:beta-galactosidase trimerization domain-containing protein [Candidatus Obscuribacterales bacterium]